MRPIRCHHFEARLDDWVSGTLPDYERSRMDEHEAGCTACRELAEASREIIGAAHREALELPGDAYFLDLRTRLEHEFAFRSRPGSGRRAPFLSLGQYASLTMALICALLFLTALPLPVEARRDAQAIASPIRAGAAAADPVLSMKRNQARINVALNLIDRST